MKTEPTLTSYVVVAIAAAAVGVFFIATGNPWPGVGFVVLGGAWLVYGALKGRRARRS